MTDDLRQQRHRQASARAAIDRLGAGRPSAGGVYRGRVFDDGALPTAVPRVFMTRPLATSCVESVGTVPTRTPHATHSVPVLVLGPRVPVAGDDLTAHLVQGVWTARTPSPSGLALGCACPVPARDLQLTYDWRAKTHRFGSNPRTDCYQTRVQVSVRLRYTPAAGFTPASWASDCYLIRPFDEGYFASLDQINDGVLLTPAAYTYRARFGCGFGWTVIIDQWQAKGFTLDGSAFATTNPVRCFAPGDLPAHFGPFPDEGTSGGVLGLFQWFLVDQVCDPFMLRFELFCGFGATTYHLAGAPATPYAVITVAP